MKCMAMTNQYAIFVLMFQFSLFTINRMTCISIESYNKFIKSSLKYKGLQYPYATTLEQLDHYSFNCLSHQLDRNDTYMKCASYNSCFVSTVLVLDKSISASWNVHERDGGCWMNTSNGGTPRCESLCLFDVKKHGKFQFVSFCTCTGSLCNKKKLLDSRFNNLTDRDCKEHEFATAPAIPIDNGTSRSLIITIAISSATLIFIIVCLMVLSCLKQKEKSNSVKIQFTQNLNQEIRINAPLGDALDDLLHGNLIHLGYHSSIRLGIYRGETVAVKVMSPNCSSQFDNEIDIFRTLGEHSNIAKFISCDQPYYKSSGILLMEYYQSGSLLSFIRHHTLTWKQMMKMLSSIADGLSYLHKKYTGDWCKPAIAHRDLNSRNILIKLDGTCVLADFGFALKLVEKPSSRCHIPIGSPRYMSPEVLSRNLLMPGWKKSIKRVDIYALGLVFWELCLSCYEIYIPGLELPKCTLPYEEELGNGPSMNQVRQYVCEQKMRPNFPEKWDLKIMDLGSLKLLIEECWSQDPKGRPDAPSIADKLKLMLSRCDMRDVDGVHEYMMLTSDTELHFKVRERSNSFNEFMCDDVSEISDSLLLKQDDEEERSTVA